MNLAEARQALGWSRTELARQAKITRQTVTSAEDGKRITGHSARKIAEALSAALGKRVLVKDIEGMNVRV